MSNLQIQRAIKVAPTFIISCGKLSMKVWRKKGGNIVVFKGLNSSSIAPRFYRSDKPFFTTDKKKALISQFNYLLENAGSLQPSK